MLIIYFSIKTIEFKAINYIVVQLILVIIKSLNSLNIIHKLSQYNLLLFLAKYLYIFIGTM